MNARAMTPGAGESPVAATATPSPVQASRVVGTTPKILPREDPAVMGIAVFWAVVALSATALGGTLALALTGVLR